MLEAFAARAFGSRSSPATTPKPSARLVGRLRCSRGPVATRRQLDAASDRDRIARVARVFGRVSAQQKVRNRRRHCNSRPSCRHDRATGSTTCWRSRVPTWASPWARQPAAKTVAGLGAGEQRFRPAAARLLEGPDDPRQPSRVRRNCSCSKTSTRWCSLSSAWASSGWNSPTCRSR